MSLIDPTIPVPTATFREVLPAFNSVDAYPDAQVRIYLDLAFQSLDARRWAQLFGMGQIYWAAHFLALDAADTRGAAAGGVPGAVTGLMTSKSVGGVSLSYDLAATAVDGAGHFNQTTYGRRYMRWVKLVGMGGAQIG